MDSVKENLKRYRSGELVEKLAERIRSEAERAGPIKLMHICGSHEHEIVRYGLRSFLPESLRIVPGPGCPVCICPVEAIDQAIHLSLQPKVTLLSFGDMIRVPGSRESLDAAKRRGGSVKVIYSPLDSVEMANAQPEKIFVFFSVGFETTAAGVAGMVLSGLPENLKILTANRYMPPVLKLLMEVHDESIQGFILPGHAAAITGLEAYRFMETRFKLPCAVAGFEPVDILFAVLELLTMINKGEHLVKNSYPRAVKNQGNTAALEMIDRVFHKKAGIWRGIERIDGSAFRFKKEFEAVDAECQLDCDPGYPPRPHPPGCQCHRVMLGEMLPTDCKMFKAPCTPQDPYGPCMVSSEGTCNVWYGQDELIAVNAFPT